MVNLSTLLKFLTPFKNKRLPSPSSLQAVAGAGALVVGVALTVGLVFFILSPNGASPVSQKLVLEEESKLDIVLRAKGMQAEDFIHISRPPQQGRLQGAPPKVTYIPEPDFFGKDHFEFTVRHGESESSAGWVELEVKGKNDAPRAKSYRVRVEKNKSAAIKLQAIDADGDFITYRILQAPGHGELKGEPPYLEYLPAPGYTGTDWIVFAGEDTFSQGEVGRIEIRVGEKNQAPMVKDIHLQSEKDQAISFHLKATDAEKDPLTYELLSQPRFGQLISREGALVYQPNPGFKGKDSFHFLARDPYSPSAVATVTLLIREAKGKERLEARLKNLFESGGVMVGEVQRPDLLYQEGNYIPASLTKVATAAAALYILGKKHRFRTEVYFEGGTLYLKGFGDPSFSSRDLHALGDQLKSLGVFTHPLRGLVADDTAFEIRPDFDGRVVSVQVWDAPIGALAVNQNTARVEVLPGRRVRSLEANTPLTHKAEKRARSFPPAMHHFAVARNAREGTQYTLELAEAIFKQKGMRLAQEPRIGQAPTATPILRYSSSAFLEEVIRVMLAESSNFIANQLVLDMALKKFGSPAKIEDGVYLLRNFLQKEVGLSPKEVALVEGSGLSRKNRMTLKGMTQLLDYFKPYKHLLP